MDKTTDEYEVEQLAYLDRKLDDLADQAREIRGAQNRIMIKRQQRQAATTYEADLNAPFEVVAELEYDPYTDSISPGTCECGKELGH